MKKKILVISLLALSGALIGSATPAPQYRFSGEEAVAYLIRNGECRDCDLSNQDLRTVMRTVNRKHRDIFIDLSGANLSHVNLSDTDLRSVTIYISERDTNLTGANLTNANLCGGTMRNVNMTGVNLTNACLVAVTMCNVNMTDANTTDADMTGVTMYNVNTTGANISDAQHAAIWHTSTK